MKFFTKMRGLFKMRQFYRWALLIIVIVVIFYVANRNLSHMLEVLNKLTDKDRVDLMGDVIAVSTIKTIISIFLFLTAYHLIERELRVEK